MIKRALQTLLRLPWLARDVRRTRGTSAPITWSQILRQFILGINGDVPWPVDGTSTVSGASRIVIGIGTAPGLGAGCYIQAINGIHVGDYTLIAPGVGLISANHSPLDTRKHVPAPPIRIGRYCWIGMNAIVLPGVCLGDHTVVGAGAVVTHSFPDGYCVLAGVPAKVLASIPRDKVIEYRYRYEYRGFIFVRQT
jgi:acetyltransferase-like isoleucine patch superfamily enzyme